MCEASSFEEIVQLAQGHEAVIKFKIYAIHMIQCLNLVADGYEVDEESQHLYPEDATALTPVRIYGGR